MTPRYWLARTKHNMKRAGLGYLWIPGSTTWRHYMPDLADARRAIRDARTRGTLAGRGIPSLTRRGSHEISRTRRQEAQP
jgi:hypothetical protein